MGQKKPVTQQGSLMDAPFAGTRVVDLTRGLAGEMAVLLLADFGAQVLRVETPAVAPSPPGAVGWRRGRRRIDLDMAQPQDRTRLEELIDAADVVALDAGPAELRRLDLDPEALALRRPRQVVLWTPPYGTGPSPWNDLPERHGLLMALSGAPFRQGAWGDGPVWHIAPIARYAQAALAATAAGAALLARARTGRGRLVTVSGLHGLGQAACPLTEPGGAGMGRNGPIGASPAYRLYRCGDGRWLFLGTLFPHFFEAALEALDLEDAAYRNPGAALERRFLEAPRDHWIGLLRARSVPAGPVERREDWLANPICTANDLVARFDHPEVGEVVMPGLAARLEGSSGCVGPPMSPADAVWLASFLEPRAAAGAADDPPAQPEAPLAGIRVLDLGTVIAGTYAASILANFGAEVIKIEGASGDPFRFALTSFINYNRGKRGLGLDLKAPDGRNLFLDLCRDADVVLDNWRLGVRERLGIGHAAVRAANSGLISVSANTYGSRGPQAALPGFDPLIQAESGLMAAQGGEDEPVFHTIPVNDVATAALTAFAVVAALAARERSGQGQVVETSLAASGAFFQFGDLVAYRGRAPAPRGAADCRGVSALLRFYRCADGWIALAAEGCPLALGEALGLDAEDQPLHDGSCEGDLAKRIEAHLRRAARDAALAALERCGVPAVPVLTPAEAAISPFLWAEGYYEVFEHPQWGPLVGSRGFAAFDGETARFSRLEPELGEHGPEVLFEAGLDVQRIRELARAGVIFRA